MEIIEINDFDYEDSDEDEDSHEEDDGPKSTEE